VSEPDWAHHCAEFAADHLKAKTGREFWDEFGGCPKSPREAANFYRRMGVTNFRDAVSRVLGEPASPAFAMRDDIVMADNALGICRGELVEFMDRMQPISRASCCWHIK
jgi:hypothetical protein